MRPSRLNAARTADLWTACHRRPAQSSIPRAALLARRGLRIYATPSSSAPAVGEVEADPDLSQQQPDARFEVLGAPFSLLSVSLSASQNLYTRRGTLVSVSGKAENTVSTLSVLSPFTRGVLGVPFLYQRITSTSPITALIATKSPATSFATVHLDGRVDWILAQRSALLAWTGHGLTVRPSINPKLSIAHWGNSYISGRGLIGLVGKGQIYQISLKAGEEYVVHPSHVVAYSKTQQPPVPYRFMSSTFRFQIPSLSPVLPNTRFFNELRKSQGWKVAADLLFKLRTWARRSIWGDRLFLHFQGPTTVLLQSRGSRIFDSLSNREINEIADVPAGTVQEVLDKPAETPSVKSEPPPPATAVKFATVGQDKVEIKDRGA
ncbi:hypothetical protein EJ06DRAFT_528736 [Trichodelitschia bisporula]|uniref:Altered inheritance of mitochondria protein 24, mitochondrial n=1 Tax=Trichodelitschia bisporula TaxID=703511 RepID=A0A6G1I386_9PEZI|nr:hypothetical protein EJ06DRAFT_528736 [Trichodelitschia bisporula]